MQDNLQPIIHKAAVTQLRLRLAQSGLSIGDKVEMRPLQAGGIGVFATLRRRWLGLIPRRVDMLLGELAESAGDVVAPALEHGEALRVRIVDLTPEHLAPDSTPELHVSIWGDPAHMACGTQRGTAIWPASGGTRQGARSTPAATRARARPVNGAARANDTPPQGGVPAGEPGVGREAPEADAPRHVAPPDAAPKGVIFRKSRIHDGPAGR